jgi:hypothetical protein
VAAHRCALTTSRGWLLTQCLLFPPLQPSQVGKHQQTDAHNQNGGHGPARQEGLQMHAGKVAPPLTGSLPGRREHREAGAIALKFALASARQRSAAPYSHWCRRRRVPANLATQCAPDRSSRQRPGLIQISQRSINRTSILSTRCPLTIPGIWLLDPSKPHHRQWATPLLGLLVAWERTQKRVAVCKAPWPQPSLPKPNLDRPGRPLTELSLRKR